MKYIEKAAIIGAGPAGIAAALQFTRYGIKFRIFEKKCVGGLLSNANLIENYPGFPKDLSGTNLVKYFKQQLYRRGIQIDKCEIKEVDYDIKNKYFILTSDHSIFHTHFLIVASGTKSKILPILSPSLKKSKYILNEIDFLKNSKRKKIAVIGAGDAAFDYSLNLSKRKNKIMIFNRSDSYKCLKLLYNRIKKTSRISYFKNFHLQQIEENQSGLTLTFTHHELLRTYYVDFLLIAIGREPALDFISKKFILKKNLLVKEGILHFAGDVGNGLYRQTAIAVGEGVKAAMIISDKLKENNENFINSW